MSPPLLETLTDDADLAATGFAAGAGAGSVLVPDLKYEQPETASAASRIRERIV